MKTLERIISYDVQARREAICSIIKEQGREYFLDNSNDEWTGEVCNIIIPPIKQDEVNGNSWIMAHYDLYPGSNGINDNGCAISAILQCLNYIPENIGVVFTDLEEKGGIGCDEFCKKYKPKAVFNFDVCGFGDNITVERYGYNESLPSHKRISSVPFNDSHVCKNHGVPSILVITTSDSPNWLHEIWVRQHGGELDNDLSTVSQHSMDITIDFIESLCGMVG